MSVAAPPIEELPGEFQPRAIRRRALQATAALAVLVAILVLAPGLGEVRDRLAGPRDAPRGPLLRLLRADVRADLLHRAELEAKLADRRIGACDGLVGSG